VPPFVPLALPSCYGESSAVPQLLLGRLREANDDGKPAPATIKAVTAYAVMAGAKSPADAEFAVLWIRPARDSLAAK
jgi:hypothetical protein